MFQPAAIRNILILYVMPVVCLLLALTIHATRLEIVQAGTPIFVVIGALSVFFVFSTIFVVLYHAEAVSHTIGEPYGTLVLTFSVTTIEVSIIMSMMLHGANNPTLARESVFSTVMIVCCGVVGLCLALGGWKHRHQDIKRQGTSAFLAVLIALTVLTLVLPNFTLSTTHGTFSPAQLVFVSVISILLYSSFVFAQAVGQKDDFMQVLVSQPVEKAHRPSSQSGLSHFVFLIVGLVGIVLLTEQVAAGVEVGLDHFHIEQADAIVGALIAFVVLMPEAVSAIRASLGNELQRGLNIALGSACATIGLTIPTVALASVLTGRPLTLGLNPGDTVLLLLGLSISIVSFGTGRTTVLTGLAHLAVFVAYILLIFVP